MFILTDGIMTRKVQQDLRQLLTVAPFIAFPKVCTFTGKYHPNIDGGGVIFVLIPFRMISREAAKVSAISSMKSRLT